MPKDIQLKSFSGGMNKDMDYSILPENTYVDAQNFKLVADEDSNGFTLENSEGNSSWYDISSEIGAGYQIAGHCYIAPYLVLFVTENITDNSPDGSVTGNVSKIVKIRVDRDLQQQSEVIYTDGGSKGWLNLSVTHPIQTEGVYESDDIIKVYWVDGYNEDRYVNIMDSGVSTQTVDKFSMSPNFPDTSAVPLGKEDLRLTFEEYIAGTITASTVQYTYQFYNVNGSATKYAPVSPAIPIGVGNPDSNIVSNYKGAVQDENTDHGCKLSLRIPATKIFNRIRLIALDYQTLNGIPRVRVFSELELDTTDTSTTYYFRDTGDLINEIVYEDFLTMGDVTYTSKDLETKDNILFKSNVREDAFDVSFDARAYRHNAAGVAKVFEADFVSYIEIDDGAGGPYYDFDQVPDTHDCINLYNSSDYEGNASYQYKFQANGSTWGAEGENVKLEFVTKDLVIDNLGVNGSLNITFDANVDDNPGSPYNVAYSSSYQRHEVYRYGIVFFNQKLQASPVKWVCDLKMPNHSDNSSAYEFSSLSAADTSAHILGVKVTLKNIPTEDDYFAWQLVRVKRTSSDRSVLANGIIQNPYDNTTEVYPRATSLTREDSLSGSTVNDPNTLILISPEINFNQNLEHRADDFIQYNGPFLYTFAVNTATIQPPWIAHKLNNFAGNGDYTTSSHTCTFSDFRIVPRSADPNDKISIGSTVYQNYSYGDTTVGGNGYFATTGVGFSSSPINPDPTSNITVAYVSYRRNVFESQYGGVDYYSRQRNEYVGCSKVQYSATNINSYEGDTNIGFFGQHFQMINFDATASTSDYISLLFPVETSIVLNLRHDKYIVENINQVMQQETAGTYDENIHGFDYYYVQETDAYQYNSVYSLFGGGQIYLDTLLDQSDQTYFPTRVRNSDVKINGEVEDSFTIFRSNNYIDVEGKYGAVNNLLNFKNQLYFWQDKGFGALSVNTRSLIEDNNPGVLALGTGGILDRYDYISNSSGNQNPYSVVPSKQFIYWVDTNKNEIVKFTGQDRSLSKVKGLQTWINGKGKLGWVVGGYDYKYNDILYTMSFSRVATHADTFGGGNLYTLDSNGTLALDGTQYNIVLNGEYSSDEIDGKNNVTSYNGANSKWLIVGTRQTPSSSIGDKFYFNFKNDVDNTYTLAFNEQVDKFVSFQSFEPYRYITLDETYLTTGDNYHLYQHNSSSASRSTYYGVTYDSTVSTVFNKDYPFTKVFDVIKWVSDSRDSNNINIFKDTFDEVTIYNDYQNTGDRKLYYQHDSAPVYARVTPLSRRERTWSMQVPRNIVNADVDTNPDIQDSNNWDETLSNKGRMKDKYLLCDFVYDNTNAYTFSVPFI
jgi:hypothetical protein